MLIDQVRRGRSLCHKGQLEMLDDSVHHGIVGEEGNDAHLALALGTEERVDFVDLADHLGPALGGDGPELVLDNPEWQRCEACLPDFPPMGIGVEAK